MKYVQESGCQFRGIVYSRGFIQPYVEGIVRESSRLIVNGNGSVVSIEESITTESISPLSAQLAINNI